MVTINGRVVGFVALAGVAVTVAFALTKADQQPTASTRSVDVASAAASVEPTAPDATASEIVASTRRSDQQVASPREDRTRALGDGHGGFPDDWRDGIDPPEGLDPVRLRAFYESSLANEERVAARLERSLAQSPSRDELEVELAVARARRDEVKQRLEQLP